MRLRQRHALVAIVVTLTAALHGSSHASPAASAPAATGGVVARLASIPRGGARVLLPVPPLGNLWAACRRDGRAQTWFRAGRGLSVTVLFERGGVTRSALRRPGTAYRPAPGRRSETQLWVLHSYAPEATPLATLVVTLGPGAAGSGGCGLTLQGAVSSVASR